MKLSNQDLLHFQNEKFNALNKIRIRAFAVAIFLWALYILWDIILHSEYDNITTILTIRLLGLFFLCTIFFRIRFCRDEDSIQLNLVLAVIVAMLLINAMALISPAPDRYIDYWGGEILIYLYLYMLLGISPSKALIVGSLLFISKIGLSLYLFEHEILKNCLNNLECRAVSEKQFYRHNTVSSIYILSVIAIGVISSFWIEDLLKSNIFKQRDLEHLKKEADQAREFIINYTKSVAHDLLSPMSTLNDLLQSINPKQDSAKKNLMASIISKSSSKISSIFNEVNTYSAEYKPKAVIIDLEKLINQIIFSTTPLANKLNKSIRHRKNRQQIYVLTDPVLLGQLFENILINSIKHAKIQDLVKSHIIVRLSKNRHATSLKIIDRGVSSSRSQLISLIQKDIQVSKNQDEITAEKNLGFGHKIISNNMQLLEKINHSFSIKIRDPIGTIFTIELPLFEADSI